MHYQALVGLVLAVSVDAWGEVGEIKGHKGAGEKAGKGGGSSAVPKGSKSPKASKEPETKPTPKPTTASPTKAPDDCPATQFCAGEDDESRCQTFGGECLAATVAFLTPGGDPSVDPSSLLKYGKYCGRGNRCSPRETDDLPCFDRPDACGGVDAACKNHDECLDSFIEEYEVRTGNTWNGANFDIALADRLECDAVFVSALFEAVQPTPTYLCDEGFYSEQALLGGLAPINLVGHESVLMAAPFCCSADATMPFCSVSGNLPDGSTNRMDSTLECANAIGLCTQFATALKTIGINQCALAYGV